MFLAPSDFIVSNVVAFPKLRNYFCKHTVIITERSDGKDYEKETQVAINRNYLLSRYKMIMSFKSKEVIQSALPLGVHLVLEGRL